MSGLDRNGWGNAYYAAAVQAGTRSWKAFFFGSLDASNFITVDKAPAFLRVMEIFLGDHCGRSDGLRPDAAGILNLP